MADTLKEPCYDDVSVSVVPRGAWGGALPLSETPYDKPPVFVRFVHTDVDRPCADDEMCRCDLRDLQQKHLDDGHTDINYNFMIGADGKIYEGRGWKTRVELPPDCKDFAEQCLDIAYMGRFTYTPPDEELMKAAFSLLIHGITTNAISPFFDFKHMMVKERNTRE